MKKGREQGASLVEYALTVALISIACLVSIRQLGEKASEKFCMVSQGVSGDSGGGSAMGYDCPEP